MGQKLTPVLAASRSLAVVRTRGRIQALVDQYASTDEARSALRALAWDVGCDVVTGLIRPTDEDVTHWLIQRSVDFGLAFTGDVQVIGRALLNAVGFSLQRSDAAEACSQIADVGL
ncbi:MAG: hypothetical protein ACRDHO_06215 [Actinomycetota bacterium]